MARRPFPGSDRAVVYRDHRIPVRRIWSLLTPAVALALLLLPLTGQTQTPPAEWHTTQVDAAGSANSSLVLDVRNNPHVAYQTYPSPGVHNLYYALSETGTFGRTYVASMADGGTPILALDGMNRPHIVYTACTPVNCPLKYAHDTGSGWAFEDLASNASGPSFALDEAGHPHVAYCDAGLHYKYWDGSQWVAETVTTEPCWYSTSLDLDGQGRPHISFYAHQAPYLGYATKPSYSWLIQEVDTSGDVGFGNSLKVDGSGRPHISYYDRTNHTLKRAILLVSTLEQWYIERVQMSVSDGGNPTSLALGPDDQPHIAYWNNAIRYAYWTGTTWASEQVSAGMKPSLALDDQNRPHLSYGNAGITYAWREEFVPPPAPVLQPIDNPEGDGEYVVDWSAVEGAERYTLQESTNIDFDGAEPVYTGPSTEHLVSGKPAGETWYYRVRASNTAGDSAWSNVVSATVKPNATGIYLSSPPDGSGSYQLCWDAATGATSYDLTENDQTVYSGPNLCHTVVAKPAGSTWEYQARACNAGGCSAWSDPLPVTLRPAPPTLNTVENSDGNGDYFVTWSMVDGAQGYILEEDEDEAFGSPTPRYEGTAPEAHISGQSVGRWYYRVQAFNASGSGPWSNAQSADVRPEAPGLLPVANTDCDGSYQVCWQSVPGASGYTLQEDDEPEFGSPAGLYTGPNTCFQVTGRTGGAWYYRVRAASIAGDSPWSDPQQVQVAPAAPALSPIDNTDGDGEYLVDWSDVSGAALYILHEDDNPDFTTPTEAYGGAASEHPVSGQTAGTWYYRVRGVAEPCQGPWSTVQSTTVSAPPPQAPILSPISNADGDGSYLVDWSDVTGATNYSLEEDDNAAFTSPTTRYSGANSQYSVTGQATGTWHYRVKASNANGDSAWSGGQSVTVQTSAGGDAYEVDDTCATAKTITLDGTPQTHNFHDEGDEDWVQFQAEADKTYTIQVANTGTNVDAVIMLYNQCSQPPLASEHNAFGPTVKMQWDAPAAATYYLRLIQNDPSKFGAGTNYDLSVQLDTQPPAAPRSLRAASDDQKLVVQWQRSPERDVATYVVWWGEESGPPYSSYQEVDGAGNTFYNITGLTNGTLYYIGVQAEDLSGNTSDFSREVAARPAPSTDTTQPAAGVDRPATTAAYTTTLGILTVGGTATDAGQNLSRAHVSNTTTGSQGWDNGLAGASASWSVEGITLAQGQNTLQVTVYDTAGNTGTASLTVNRLSQLSGVVVLAGGRNNSSSLQTNINYVTNRAYRVFQSAGIPAANIYYLSPSSQDADGDGMDDVRATTTPANLHTALQWAAGKLSAGVPFYLYLMDHGAIEAFCADGCSAPGRLTSEQLDTWLDELEASSSGSPVNVIIEACHSGSFVDRFEGLAKSISKDGRVVIASTGRTNNAYASAQGAFFSDAFFSAISESRDLKDSFDRAHAAVQAAGFNQTPWLDDNGDGLYSPADGIYAANRRLAAFFGALLPEITSASVELDGTSGQISATVQRGDEPVRSVWAAVYPPSYQEPDYTTLNPGVPLVELEADAEQPGDYAVNYNGFIEAGTYRVVIYADDAAGNQAFPRRARAAGNVAYLPVVVK